MIAKKPHDFYTRNGNDLLIQQKITHVEALKGTILEIPTLDGRSLLVTLLSRVNLGYEHKVPYEGMLLTKVTERKDTLKISITNIKYREKVKSSTKKLGKGVYYVESKSVQKCG